MSEGIGPQAIPVLAEGRRRAAVISEWLPPAALIGALLLLWQLVAEVAGTPRWFLPAPSDIAAAMVGSADLLAMHGWVTIQEVAIGFVASFVFGVAAAVAIAYSRIVERVAYPLVVASQTVPVIAIAPILLIWFGYELTPKVIVVVLICFFPIVVNTVDGLRAVDPDLVNLLRSMGASRWQVFTKAQLPTSLPFLFSGTKVAIAVSVIGAVIGEWVGASAGLGYFMVRAASQMRTDRVFAAVVVLSVMGIALFAIASISERYLLPWYHDRRRGQATGRWHQGGGAAL